MGKFHFFPDYPAAPQAPNAQNQQPYTGANTNPNQNYPQQLQQSVFPPQFPQQNWPPQQQITYDMTGTRNMSLPQQQQPQMMQQQPPPSPPSPPMMPVVEPLQQPSATSPVFSAFGAFGAAAAPSPPSGTTFCGVRDPTLTGRAGRILGGRPSEFGAWPWMVWIG